MKSFEIKEIDFKPDIRVHQGFSTSAKIGRL